AADSARFFRLLGANGAFYKAGLDPQETKLRAGARLDNTLGLEDESAWGRITDTEGATRSVRSERGDWLSFYKTVRTAIETDGPAPVPMRESAMLAGVIDAVFESVKTGRRVDLPKFLAERGVQLDF